MESIMIALKLSGLGLAGVFISLICLYLLIRVTGRVFKPKDNEETKEGSGR